MLRVATPAQRLLAAHLVRSLDVSAFVQKQLEHSQTVVVASDTQGVVPLRQRGWRLEHRQGGAAPRM
jgi:nitrogen fixation protein